jgi:hypothetical protein
MTNLQIAKFFAHDHLPPDLARISKPFGELADTLVIECSTFGVTTGGQLAVALQKLLEAKDAAVRAFLETKAPR